jgi:hypothetical protein
MALEQGWSDQELDHRPSCLNDEPVRLALSVDLGLTEWKSHLRETHGGFFTVARPGEMWYSMLAAK